MRQIKGNFGSQHKSFFRQLHIYRLDEGIIEAGYGPKFAVESLE